MKTITIFGIIIILVVAWLCGCTYTNKNNELVIEKFEVKPTVINRGETAVISWEVKGATSVTIDNGIGNVNSSGSRVVRPDVTTNYTLSASNGTASKKAVYQIIVNTVSEETGILSGRILYDNISLRPVYNASVLVNGKPADMYGATYLALNVSAGEATVEARGSDGKTIKETVIVEPSAVNSADLILSGSDEGTPPGVTSTPDHLLFSWGNGLSVELRLNGDRLAGIGEVKINGTSLRKPSSSGLPTIEKIGNGNFAGIRYEKCQYIGYETRGEIAIVHSKLVTIEGDVSLDWIFTPWGMLVEGNRYNGLGYRFSISSPVNISKMGFNCSWELNENISGKTLLTRREKEEWGRECTQSDGFQTRAFSLLVQSQPLDYQYDNSGALASFIWPPGEMESTLQKANGSDQLWFADKFSFGETKQAESPFRVVLYTSNGGLDEYTYLLDKVNEEYRKFYGLSEAELIPTALASNYLHEEGQQLKIGTAPDYRKAADRNLPEIADLNFKQLLIIYVWTSNGRVGAPYDGNRLATLSIDVHPDDVDDLKYFVEKTHDLAMKFSVWLSACFSQKSPLYENNDWQITDVTGRYPSAASGDVYVMSFRSGYLSYALERLRAVKEEFGFDGIWHDSFTAGSMTDYSASSIEPPINQQMQFLSATQRMGYSPYVESISSFGITSVGSVAVTPPNSPHGSRDLKTAFGGREYLAYKTSFTVWESNDYSPLQIDYYKFLANKAVPLIDPQLLNGTEKVEVSRANKDYNSVSSYMDKRHVLPNDEGILWYNEESNTQVLFSYKEFSYSATGSVYDITVNSSVELSNGSFTTKAKHTYKLQ